MALTQTDLDALDSAIASAELEVQLEGRRVRYRSTDELIKARNHVASVLAGAAAGVSRRRSFGFDMRTSRGD